MAGQDSATASTFDMSTHSNRPPATAGPSSSRRAQNQHGEQPDMPLDEVVQTSTVEVLKHPDGKYVNQYQFVRQLGKGQHGEVFQALDRQNNRMVAIKQVKRKNPKIDRMSQLRRKNLPSSPHVPLTDNLGTTEHKIRKEIAIMKKCRHPHVVRLLEVIDDKLDKSIYMVMEYLGGGEIKWRTPDDRPTLRVSQIRRICRDVILGLEYLHNQGIIHRDIKPANLLWTEDRRMVKIADFGVSHFSYAQRLAAASSSARKGGQDRDSDLDPLLMDDSDLSKFAGTPMFLAPEIVYDSSSVVSSNANTPGEASSAGESQAGSSTPTLRKPPITKAIDVWAFGVTLYGLLFGHLPFRGSNEFQIYNMIRTEDWDVPETMGSDEMPTGGRHPDWEKAKNDERYIEGYWAVDLLEKLLTKDVGRRITLDGVKRHPWMTHDMTQHEAHNWVHTTYEDQASASHTIVPTEEETRNAVLGVRFYWSRTQWARRVARLFERTSRSLRRSTALTGLAIGFGGVGGASGTRGREGREDRETRNVGTQSMPQVGMSGLSRHRSEAAVATRGTRHHHRRDPELQYTGTSGPASGSQRKRRTKTQSQKLDSDVHRTGSTPARTVAAQPSSSTAGAGPSSSAQRQPASTFELFSMWNDGGGPSVAGSGTKKRRGSEPSGKTLSNLRTSLGIGGSTPKPGEEGGPPLLNLQSASSSRVNSPVPPTPGTGVSGSSPTAYEALTPSSDDPHYQHLQSPPQQQRPRSRTSQVFQPMKRLFGFGKSSASTSPTYPSSPQDPSVSTLPVHLPSSQRTPASSSIRGDPSRLSADIFTHSPHHNTSTLRNTSRQSSSTSGAGAGPSGGAAGFSRTMRSASWGDFTYNYTHRPSEDMMSIYSGEKGTVDELDQDTFMMGAGGVARSPVSSLPTSGALSTVSSSASLGPPILQFSAAQLLLHRSEPGAIVDSRSPRCGASTQQVQGQQGQSGSGSGATSPLARPSIGRGELRRQPSSYDSVFEDDDEDEDEDEEGVAMSRHPRSPPPRSRSPSPSTSSGDIDIDVDDGASGQETPLDGELSLQPSTSEMYRQEDQGRNHHHSHSDGYDDEEGSEDSDSDVSIPLEVKTRRPSVNATTGMPSRSMSPQRDSPQRRLSQRQPQHHQHQHHHPHRSQSPRSERTLVYT